jgi:integrase
MTRSNPDNQRIKHRYFGYLEEAKQLSSVSVDQVAASLTAFERSTNGRAFSAFRLEQARKFKRDLSEATHERTGKPLAVATIRSRLMAVKDFFFWLAGQPGFRSKIKYGDCDYFNPSANDTRIATATRHRAGPSLEQVHHVIATAPHQTDIEKRDRALIAFALLTGMRDAALASLPIRLVNLHDSSVFQDARLVHTKRAKTMTTTFFPVGGDCEAIVRDWIAYLTGPLLFGPDDPLFPATHVGLSPDGQFAANGLKRDFWSGAAPIRRIFKERFQAANLPYFHPHSLRKTLAILGQTRCRTPEEFKAWSQNLSHEHVLTTFTSYGQVDGERQAQLVRGLDGAIPQAGRTLSDADIERLKAAFGGH